MVQSIITNGVVFYIHMAAANSADGTVDFTLDPLEGGPYLYEGELVDEEEAENTDPSAYTWTLTETEEKTPYTPTLQDVADEVVVNKQATDEQLEEVDGKATAAQQVAAATANYFFADANGTHVASVAGNANSGFNTLGTSTGFAIRNGTDTLSAWSSSAIEFYDEDGATIASFGETVTLGDDSKGHAEVDFNSLTLYDTDGTGKVFEVGDMRDAQGVATLTETFYPTQTTSMFTVRFPVQSITAVTVDGTAVGYTSEGMTVTLNTAATDGQVVAITYTTTSAVNSFTFGRRTGNTGANSTAIGDAEAAGEFSFASGLGSHAVALSSHSEGMGARSQGTAAHAEGQETTASGQASHSEGRNTTATGAYSHAQNERTIAQGMAQTALGAYNVAQGSKTSRASSDHAVIVGNGTADSARSNAATLDWNGDLWVAGTVTDGDGHVLGADTLSAIVPERIDNTSGITDVAVSGITVGVSPVIIRSGYTCTLDCQYTLTAALSAETTVATGLPPRVAGAIVDVMQQSTSFARPLRAIVNTNGDLKLRYGAAGTYWVHMVYISSVPNPLIDDADGRSY